MSEITEGTMQAVLMHWCMNELNHSYVLPNSDGFYQWEADLLSVTKALLVHEFEIKISRADYNRDASKEAKHLTLQGLYHGRKPNYFWYVTFAFDIEPPEHAGWVKITKGLNGHPYHIEVKKPAPRLSVEKVTEKQIMSLARLLSFRVTNYYRNLIQSPGVASENAVLSEKLTEIQEQSLAL